VGLPSEEELGSWIDAIARGDRAAFDRLYTATLPRILAFAQRILGSEDAADDCAAETYIRVWRDAAKYDAGRGCAMAWLFTMCRSRALDQLRTNRRTGELGDAVELESGMDTAEGPESLISMFDADASVHPLLLQLTSEQRKLIGLAFFHDMSHSEIAVATGMPLGTVKSHIHRALTAMRQGLSFDGPSANGSRLREPGVMNV